MSQKKSPCANRGESFTITKTTMTSIETGSEPPTVEAKCQSDTIALDRQTVVIPRSTAAQGMGSVLPVQGGPAPAGPLPCLNKHNSVIPTEKRTEITLPDGVTISLRTLSTREKKKAFALTENCQQFIALHGLDRCGFLTLCFAENLTDPKEAQRRFNNLARNHLREMFVDYILVMEPQKRGAIHYHLLVAVKEDIRTGFDFAALDRRDYRSATPYLRGLWKRLRESSKSHGFGRTELLPIKTNGEGIGKYVGKYIQKGLIHRTSQFKGARMVRYSRGWKNTSEAFSWALTPGALKWRATVGEIAKICRVEEGDMDMLGALLGNNWAYRLLKAIEKDDNFNPRQFIRRLCPYGIPHRLRKQINDTRASGRRYDFSKLRSDRGRNTKRRKTSLSDSYRGVPDSAIAAGRN